MWYIQSSPTSGDRTSWRFPSKFGDATQHIAESPVPENLFDIPENFDLPPEDIQAGVDSWSTVNFYLEDEGWSTVDFDTFYAGGWVPDSFYQDGGSAWYIGSVT